MNRVVGKSELTKHDVSFDIVMGRLKMAIGAPTDAALCAAMGVASNTYANRKSSGSIPFDLVIATCISRSVNIDWVFTGDGAALKNGQSVNAPELINKDLLAAATIQLQRAWNAHAEYQVSDSHVARLAILAAGIYNNLIFEPDAEKRANAMQREAQDLARLANMLQEAEVATKR